MKSPSTTLEISGNRIGRDYPTYFIADIAANHDADLERAKALIYLAAEAGANAAKFQHFKAETIVSDRGFRDLGKQRSHQANWDKSVFEVYEAASLNLDWTEGLADTCNKAGIAFFTSPYAKDIVDHVDPYVPAYKIGSGDITWIEMIEYIASKQKPYLIASGASSIEDVYRAVNAGLAVNPNLCLMQCNTNYTASFENFKYIHLNVLRVYREMYPDLVLGLSDHTPGHATALGAVALGARMIEKHFTENTSRNGPDHAFSMDPLSWRDMVDRVRELESALGVGIKRIENNEKDTVVLQRRAIRTVADVAAGSLLTPSHLTVLRPCPTDGIPPYRVGELLGKRIRRDIKAGDHLRWVDIE
ncbi:MAG: N-acetylneuraminate synthase family protein [Propionivibrio sp.]|uniref:N-acetylneuraminate synthase family protein n=1 Tax=Propionivibrio sp. TaxID=2212460 RepID=UPI0025EB1508|nr:N-acetylneuraminate synthase family protein [Propionivibrio sp.]MBK7354699.1 N-acetylneuraminate synthase family protein [Propionivibrio sp.]MBK8402070.1 N-acetylneuraminate synthase family protein [Propionivibrio sp.]